MSSARTSLRGSGIGAVVWVASATAAWATNPGVDFAKRYADQNELDYQAFVESIQSGRLSVLEGV